MPTTLLRPFRADHVGSFLRPERLKVARQQKESGEITEEELKEIEDQEIRHLIQAQKDAGLKSVTDGEFRRGWWHLDFLSGLDGVEFTSTEDGIQFAGTKTKAQNVQVTGKVNFTDHYMLDHYKFLHEAAGDATAKFTIPSPNMLFFREPDHEGVYDNEEELFDDLIIAYQKAIEAFYEAGCRYLQLDDTSWSLFFDENGQQLIRSKGYTPEQLAERFAKNINGAIANKPDDLLITMHICRGNFKSTYVSSGSYENAAETIFGKLNVDGLFLEFDDERSGGFEPLRYVNRTDLTIVLGLFTSKFAPLEDPTTIQARLQEASTYLPLEQLCISPQCGFASTEEGNLLTEEEQWKKVSHIVKLSENIW